MMSGMNVIGQQEIERRKTVSDIKNDTNDLTFGVAKTKDTRAAAYQCNRNKKDDMYISNLLSQTDESDLNDMILMEEDYINGARHE